MNTRTLAFLIASHSAVAGIGFAGGIYALPILIAPAAPSATDIQAMSANATYRAEFSRDLKDSDNFHWGEGTVSIGPEFITLKGELAPGPAYKIYLSPEFVETEIDFKRLKSSMVQVGSISTFENFAVAIPKGIDPSTYNSVVVWCEAFEEFITAAQYR